MDTQARPPYDMELEAVLLAAREAAQGGGSSDTPSTLEGLVAQLRGFPLPGPDEILGDRPVEHRDLTVPGSGEGPDLTLAVFRRPDHRAGGPAVYWTHGGAMLGGNRFSVPRQALDWVERFDLVLVAVEYRLAPEHPDPAPVEDCFRGLVWTAGHAAELGFDPDRLVVAGGSAGGGLSAGTTLLARDRSGPALAGHMVMGPMLDDRHETVSAHQFSGTGLWDRETNLLAWSAVLGERSGGPDVSIYAAPARATDLAGLPPAFVDVGSAELYRDEAVAYASAIWAAGGSAELHVWAGGYHGYEGASQAAISVGTLDAREHWLRRALRL